MSRHLSGLKSSVLRNHRERRTVDEDTWELEHYSRNIAATVLWEDEATVDKNKAEKNTSMTGNFDIEEELKHPSKFEMAIKRSISKERVTIERPRYETTRKSGPDMKDDEEGKDKPKGKKVKRKTLSERMAEGKFPSSWLEGEDVKADDNNRKSRKSRKSTYNPGVDQYGMDADESDAPGNFSNPSTASQSSIRSQMEEPEVQDGKSKTSIQLPHGNMGHDTFLDPLTGPGLKLFAESIVICLSTQDDEDLTRSIDLGGQIECAGGNNDGGSRDEFYPPAECLETSEDEDLMSASGICPGHSKKESNHPSMDVEYFESADFPFTIDIMTKDVSFLLNCKS